MSAWLGPICCCRWRATSAVSIFACAAALFDRQRLLTLFCSPYMPQMQKVSAAMSLHHHDEWVKLPLSTWEPVAASRA